MFESVIEIKINLTCILISLKFNSQKIILHIFEIVILQHIINTQIFLKIITVYYKYFICLTKIIMKFLLAME